MNSALTCTLFPPTSIKSRRTPRWSSRIASEVIGVSQDTQRARFNAYARFLVDIHSILRLTQFWLCRLAGDGMMPDLPLEVIQNIFTVSLPPRPNYDDISRLDFLLPLCLVHRSLTRFAQRTLFTNVFLPDLVNAQEFVESLELNSDFGGWVKTLDFGNGRRFDVGKCDSLSKLVRRYSEVEEVMLYFVNGVNIALFAQLKSQYPSWFLSRCD